MRTGRRRIAVAGMAVVLLLGAGAFLKVSGWIVPLRGAVLGKKSVGDRVSEIGERAGTRLAPHFARADVRYPPAEVVLVGLKAEKRLDVYAADQGGGMRFIRSYPILAASGGAGPKLKRGDRQVPEGIYGIESLNPNSRFHLALRVGYPNPFDRAMAARDGRTDLGSDIMIHGSNDSVGCLAMGDKAAEDLFILAAQAGIERVRLILAPHDLRMSAGQPATAAAAPAPEWTAELYAQIRAELAKLPPPD